MLVAIWLLMENLVRLLRWICNMERFDDGRPKQTTDRTGQTTKHQTKGSKKNVFLIKKNSTHLQALDNNWLEKFNIVDYRLTFIII